jgi:hypothetical protein
MRRLSPRPLLLVAPVCGTGLIVALAAAMSFAATRHSFGELADPRFPGRLGCGQPLSRCNRARCERRHHPLVRLRHEWGRSVRLGCRSPDRGYSAATMQLLEQRPWNELRTAPRCPRLARRSPPVWSPSSTAREPAPGRPGAGFAAAQTRSASCSFRPPVRTCTPGVCAAGRVFGARDDRPLALMTSTALVLVVLWQRSPLLSPLSSAAAAIRSTSARPTRP